MKKVFSIREWVLLVIVISVLASAILALSTQKAEACGIFSACQPSAKAVERETVNNTYSRLSDAVPAPKLENSLERENISKRLTLFSNPAKISYIYLVSYGRVMAFYTVKGKITSGSKRLTATDMPVSLDCGEYCDQALGQAPELDGTYGSSDPYIYFWTTDGSYVQWNGEYMLADQPLQLSTPPELVRSVK